MNNMSDIAAGLNKLLEDTKIKPVISKQESKSEQIHKTEMNALELVRAVIECAPEVTTPCAIGEALLIAAEAKAIEMNVTTQQVMENVFDYLIETIESAQKTLEEDITSS